MLKKTICALVALLALPAAHAENYAQPTFSVEGFYGNMRATLGGTITDENGNVLVLRTLRGYGYGGRLTAALTPRLEAYGEYATHDLDIESDSGDLESDFDQYRGGVRAIARPEDLEYPIYASAGFEYARIQHKARIYLDGGSPDGIPFVKDKGNFGIGQVRAGYRSSKTHFYGGMGYGLSDDDSVFELIAGLSYSFYPSMSVFSEYRSSLFSGDGNNKNRFNDLRFGLGFGF